MRHQSGLALLSMVGVMLAVSLLVGASVQQSLLSLRLAANSSDQQVAMAAADYALRQAEAAPVSLAVEALALSLTTTPAVWRAALMQEGAALSLPVGLADRASARVLVEEIANSEGVLMYRITAFGRSTSKNAERILQVHRGVGDNSRSWRQVR